MSLSPSDANQATATTDYASADLQVALERSLETGTFIDTKIYAFSRRRDGLLVDKPLPIFANSELLQASSVYFDNCFQEDTRDSLSWEFPEDEDSFNADYAYESDSDLDEFECSNSDRADSDASSLTFPHDRVGLASRQVYLTDIGEQCGYVIIIPDVAFTTLRAVVYYLYTGCVRFKADLCDSSGSQSQTPWKGPICSPKSVYRLAAMLDLPELKEKAQACIASRLRPWNVARELRSYVSSNHEDIHDMIIDFACDPKNRAGMHLTMVSWLKEVATGDFQDEVNDICTIFRRTSSLTESPSTAPTDQKLPPRGDSETAVSHGYMPSSSRPPTPEIDEDSLLKDMLSILAHMTDTLGGVRLCLSDVKKTLPSQTTLLMLPDSDDILDHFHRSLSSASKKIHSLRGTLDASTSDTPDSTHRPVVEHDGHAERRPAAQSACTPPQTNSGVPLETTRRTVADPGQKHQHQSAGPGSAPSQTTTRPLVVGTDTASARKAQAAGDV